MATIQEAINRDTSGYARLEKAPPLSPEVAEYLLPPRNVIQICSLPNLPGIFPSTNNIIDFHVGGKVPQFRAPLAPPQSTQGTSTTATSVITTSSSSSSSTNNPAQAATASITTPPLGIGSTYQTTITMAKAFLLQKIATASAVRVELYKTAAAQMADVFRAVGTPVGLGNEQGIIVDVNLDTVPVVWDVDPAAIGSNLDSPATSTIYATITNLGAAGTSATITFTYVPMQS